jgi:hypothetical protein
MDDVKSRTRNPGSSEVDVLVSAICLLMTEDRRWRIEDGTWKSAILYPRSLHPRFIFY